MLQLCREQVDALGRRLGVTGDGIRRAAAHGIHLWATNGAVAALAFLTPLAFARLSSPVDYGRFSLIASILAIANALTLPGLTISLRQATARGFHGVAADAARARVRWSALAALALAGVALWFWTAGDRRTGVLLLIVSPLLPLIHGIDLAQPFLSGLQRFGALSAWMLTGALVPSAVVLVLLVAGSGAAAATVGYFGAVGAVNAASFAWVLARCRQNRRTDPGAIAYGKRLTLISALGALQFYVDKLVVGTFLSLEALALYSVGKMFQQALTLTWGALNQLYFPKLASRHVQDARRLTRSTLPVVWLFFAVLAGGVVLAIPWIVTVVFGARYAGAIFPAQVLTIGVLLAIPGAQFEILFTSTGDERRLYTQRVLFAASQLVLVGLGSYYFGLSGAVYGTAATYGLNSVNGFVLDRWR